MASIPIIIGDSYDIARRLWEFTFVDINGNPYDLAGCKIKTTYKATILPFDTDPNDDMAIVKHYIIINSSGVVTSSSGLKLSTTASAGKIKESLSKTETILLPTQDVYGDIRLTDANGENFTFPFLDTIKGVQSVTNRTTDT